MILNVPDADKLSPKIGPLQVKRHELLNQLNAIEGDLFYTIQHHCYERKNWTWVKVLSQEYLELILLDPSLTIPPEFCPAVGRPYHGTKSAYGCEKTLVIHSDSSSWFDWLTSQPPNTYIRLHEVVRDLRAVYDNPKLASRRGGW